MAADETTTDAPATPAPASAPKTTTTDTVPVYDQDNGSFA